MKKSFYSVILLLTATVVVADTTHHSPYSGQQNRFIASLSETDIADLEAGAGWGLAKAAELNGVPGPMHLLEMKNEINLSETQIEKITRVFNKMRSAAKKLGQQLIEQESELNEKFKNDIPTSANLRTLLAEIGDTRSSLRFTHLAAHLEMPGILTANQIENYNRLRGYAKSEDPCLNIPLGHDEKMWKKHNNCE